VPPRLRPFVPLNLELVVQWNPMDQFILRVAWNLPNGRTTESKESVGEFVLEYVAIAADTTGGEVARVCTWRRV
jgi:hypothetical protein